MCFILNMKDSFLCELEVHQLLSSDQIGEPDLVTIGFRSYDPWTQYANTGTSDNHPPPNQLFANWTSQKKHHLSHLYIPKKKEKWLRHPFILWFSNMDQTNKKHGCLARVFEAIQPKHGFRKTSKPWRNTPFHGSKTWRQFEPSLAGMPNQPAASQNQPAANAGGGSSGGDFLGEMLWDPMCWQKKLGVRGWWVQTLALWFRITPPWKLNSLNFKKISGFGLDDFPLIFRLRKTVIFFPCCKTKIFFRTNKWLLGNSFSRRHWLQVSIQE